MNKPIKIQIDWNVYDKHDKPVTGLKELVIEGVKEPVEEISPGTYRKVSVKKYTLEELKEKLKSSLYQIDVMEASHVKNKTLNYPKYYEGYRDALKMLYADLAISEGLENYQL